MIPVQQETNHVTPVRSLTDPAILIACANCDAKSFVPPLCKERNEYSDSKVSLHDVDWMVETRVACKAIDGDERRFVRIDPISYNFSSCLSALDTFSDLRIPFHAIPSLIGEASDRWPR
jgi:hypothetical protein